jgi:hypothetical protein
VYFNSFDELKDKLKMNENLESELLIPNYLLERYDWQRIVNDYQDLY